MTSIQRSNLIVALKRAIYYSTTVLDQGQSGLVEGWKEALEALKRGETLDIRGTYDP